MLITERQRVVILPCGYVVHARRAISSLEGRGERRKLRCRVNGSGVHNPRKQHTSEESTCSEVETLHVRNQDSPGIGPALDEVTTEDLTLRIERVKKIKPWPTSDHARQQTHSLKLANNERAERRQLPPRSGNHLSLIRAIKLRYLPPALPHIFYGRIPHEEHYKELKICDISPTPPWLIQYTEAASLRNRERCTKKHLETNSKGQSKHVVILMRRTTKLEGFGQSHDP